MPIVSTMRKKEIELHHDAIAKLQEKCESCKLFRAQTAKEIYTYSVCREYATDEGPVMVAIAKYGEDTYAIYAPDYLTERQLVVLEFILRDIKSEDKIVVFSQKCFNALGKYSYGKQLNVRLCLQ